MIKHIVFFNLAENAEAKSKAENAAYIKAELEALKNLIPQIITIEVGINHPKHLPEISIFRSTPNLLQWLISTLIRCTLNTNALLPISVK